MFHCARIKAHGSVVLSPAPRLVSPQTSKMSLNGKVAVVSGAAMGIGKAMTELLLQNGAKVTMLDVNEGVGRSAKEHLDKQFGSDRTLFLSCDVESEEQLKAAFQKTVETFGGFDILCNNAGILNEIKWEKSVSINLVALISATYLALEHMSKLKGGRGGVIINTASLAGLGPLLSCPVYTATKYGVVGFTRAMAAASEASGYGVRFNAVCPGFVQTNLLTTLFDNLGRYSNLSEQTQKYADRGVLTASAVADCVLELVTDDTKNGQALMVTSRFRKYTDFPQIIAEP